jgi:hypothetical protein
MRGSGCVPALQRLAQFEPSHLARDDPFDARAPEAVCAAVTGVVVRDS